MKTVENEVGDILEFIRNSLAGIKHGGMDNLSKFARRNGLLEKNLTNFLGYERTSNPTIRITYKILRGLLGKPPITLNGKDNFLYIPLVEGRIAANPGGLIPGDAVESQICIPCAELHGRHDLVAVRLAPGADSMEPALRPGDLVVIDRGDREITPRGLYAVRLPDLESCTIKRLQLIPDQNIVLLLSVNLKYEPLPVPYHEHLIIGRVIWSLTDWISK